MYIVVVGGGKVGYHLVRTLRDENYEVTLIEKDKARYEELLDKLGEGVVYGDGTVVEALQRAGVSRADVLISVAGEDEDNLVICQLAKAMFMVPKTIARVNDPTNERLFKELGVNVTINATRIIFSLLEEVSTTVCESILTFDEGTVELVKLQLPINIAIANKRLMDIAFPQDTIVLSIIRNGKVIIPRGSTQLKPQDTLIVITSRENIKRLDAMLSNSGKFV